MSIQNSPIQIFPEEKDNHNETSTILTTAWLGYIKTPDSGKRRGDLAAALNRRLGEFLPDRAGTGLLAGRANEIRQEALLLTLSKYLSDNRALLLATQRQETIAIESQVERSLRGALKIASMRLARSETNRARKTVGMEAVPKHSEPSCQHPSQQAHLGMLPVDGRLALVFAGLRLAVRQNLVPRRSAGMLAVMLRTGMSAEEMAGRRKISKSAVYQSIRPAKVYLRRYVKDQEFPM